MSHSKRVVSVALFAWIAVATSASAGTIVLGGGWQASCDPSLDSFVDLHVDAVTADALYIEKSAEFTLPPGPGGFRPIAIQFEQIASPAVSRIIIDDEILTNHTGSAWTDFHWDLLDEGEATFDQTPPFFFSTAPLNHQVFPNPSSFWVDGFGLGPGGSNAVVPNNSVWFPGGGTSDGQLVMNVVPHQVTPYTVFVLKETQTPEPASALLMLAGLGLMRRRGGM